MKDGEDDSLSCVFASPLFFVTREGEISGGCTTFIFDKRTRDKNNRKYDASHDVFTLLHSKPLTS